jgi:large subunit ribosomal protein L34e
MVRRYLRTRSEKKVKVRTPGGRNVTHFKMEKTGKAECGRCGNNLGGMPNRTQSEIRVMKSSERIPSRPYAGVLCNECMDDLVRYVTRLEVKYTHPEYKKLDVQRDLTLEKFLPANWHQEVSAGNIRKEKVEKKAAPGKKKEKSKAEEASVDAPEAKKKEKAVKKKKA